MKENTKKGLVALLGGIGLVVLLIGIFTEIYEFNTGLIIAIAIWILSGVVSTMLGIKK